MRMLSYVGDATRKEQIDGLSWALKASGFWYVATPYSKFATGLDQAYRAAVDSAVELTKAGIVVFAPIVHSHPLSLNGVNEPSWAFWKNIDLNILAKANGLLVITLPGWQESTGVTEEIASARAQNKPIFFIEPNQKALARATARDTDELVEDTNILLGVLSLQEKAHRHAVVSGWYYNEDGSPKERNVGEMVALAHSELSEALEGYRKDLMDDKLPHRKIVEVELADLFIRVADTAEYLGLDLGSAILEKMEYNRTREDHKLENRSKPGGKKF